jgi:hypothetical protein
LPVVRKLVYSCSMIRRGWIAVVLVLGACAAREPNLPPEGTYSTVHCGRDSSECLSKAERECRGYGFDIVGDVAHGRTTSLYFDCKPFVGKPKTPIHQQSEAPREAEVRSAASPQAPSVHDFTTFEFFSVSGLARVYREAKLEEEQDAAHEFARGGTSFSVIGPTEGIVIGNNGESRVQLYRTQTTLVFTESAGTGEHVLAISDRWIAEYRGFAATYRRHIEVRDVIINTDYEGFVRPGGM